MTPLGVGGGAGQAAFAAALLDPERPGPAGLRTWNGSDPATRLAVHRNNVIGSLIGALADTFPVTQELVGEPFFRAMAGVFVRAEPPRTRILAHYGAGFADFIARFEPAASLPYLPDVARLEVARVRAFHAADADPVTDDAVARALEQADRADTLRLALHPSVSVLSSDFAMVSLWAAHQGDGDLAAIDVDRGEHALVLRQQLEVLVLDVRPGAAAFVHVLGSGLPVAGAASAALAADAGFDLVATLALCLKHGAITSIELP
jgi:Putative DNA-binding domain